MSHNVEVFDQIVYNINDAPERLELIEDQGQEDNNIFMLQVYKDARLTPGTHAKGKTGKPKTDGTKPS